jgi:hypothetical protein
MTKFITFLIRITFMFFNVFLFQTVWNEGVLYFFPVLPMLMYWQAFVFCAIKNLFGFHIHFSVRPYLTYLKNKEEHAIDMIETVSVTLAYLFCIALIKIIL